MRAFTLPLLLLFAIPCLAKHVEIATTTVPNGTVATSFSAVITTTNGCTPFQWFVSSGTLPPGLTATPSSSTRSFKLSGTPTTAGTYSFSIEVKGCAGLTSIASYTSVIQPSAEHVVALNWSPSKSGSISGYNLYRSTDTATWKRVNPSLIATTTYNDSTVADGNTYYYAATAVNIEGEESAMTNAVTVVIP